MSKSSRRQLVRRFAAGAPPPPPRQVEIAVPEEEGSPHGQLLMAGGIASNFTEEPWRGDDSLKDFAVRLHEFLLGEEPFLEFVSPHDGHTHLLTRLGAASIVAINHARAKGPVAPHATQPGSKIVRVGALPPELIRGPLQ